jgi:hypothetical protein
VGERVPLEAEDRVKLRFFGGMTNEEIAAWVVAKVWLYEAMERGS